MPMCSNRRKLRTSDRCRYRLALICGTLFFLHASGAGQVYVPQPPSQQPPSYGEVILDNYSSTAGPGPVVFDHWLHRAKFTCRLCHVDIGFAMQAKATGVRESTNRQGFHCGACHNGKTLFEGKPIFSSCSDDADKEKCGRCHSLGKKNVRKYNYQSFTRKFPKGIYGVDWNAAESKGLINPVNSLEGISIKRPTMPARGDFSIRAELPWVHPIVFSHEKHSVWNGCELCHPEIFPAAKKETVRGSMFLNIDGRNCGACHGKVAFPLNGCSRCHPRGPLWAP